MRLPEGKRFAFTILDDTDDSTLENTRPVYELLHQLGLRTTKTVWPVACPEGSRRYFAADTLEREDYAVFTRLLAARGFEIAFHGATMESSPRDRTLRALEEFEAKFGARPRLHANHGENLENIYWGGERFRNPLLRAVARRLGPQRSLRYEGERAESPFFWGDLCLQTFDYVRSFTFRGLNSLQFNPEMPYATHSTPYVKSWFSTTDAPNANAFVARVTPSAIDRLVAEGGICILSTHLGKGYARNGFVRQDVADALHYVARQPGWFVPVSTLLDFLKRTRGGVTLLSAAQVLRLEMRYLADRLGDALSHSSE